VLRTNSPLAGGFLTGKLTFARESGAELTRTRWQGASKHDIYLQIYDTSRMHQAMRTLKKVCDEAQPQPVTPQEAAMRWLMYHSQLREGDAIVFGAKRYDQLESNICDSQRGPLEGKLLETVGSMWGLATDAAKFS